MDRFKKVLASLVAGILIGGVGGSAQAHGGPGYTSGGGTPGNTGSC